MPVSFSEFIELSENNWKPEDPSYFASSRYRETKKQTVRKRYNERQRDMFHTKRAKNLVKSPGVRFRSRYGHIIDRGGKDITNRQRQDQRRRLNQFKHRVKNIGEGLEYLENRKAIHDAHAESSSKLARSERDPELKRLDRHRSKKHSHASAVLDKLIELHKKNKKK